MPTELIEALSRIDSPTVANAIEFFEVRDPTTGFASMELKCQYPDLKPMVGYAVTCTVDSTTPLPRGSNVRHELFKAIQAAPKPVAVVLQDIGPQRLRSCHAGDVLSTTFQNLGAVGLVTDGGVRDIAGILECSKDAVYRRLQELEVERRGKARAPKLSQYGDDHIMAVLKERGYRKAAVELGVGKTTLLRYMQRRGKKSPLNDRRKTPTPKGKRFEHGS